MPTKIHTFLELKTTSLRQKKALVHFPGVLGWGRTGVLVPSSFIKGHRKAVLCPVSIGVKLISKDTQEMTQDQVQIMSVDELMSVLHLLRVYPRKQISK